MAYEIDGRAEILPIQNVFPGYFYLIKNLGSDTGKAYRIECQENDSGAIVSEVMYCGKSCNARTERPEKNEVSKNYFAGQSNINKNESIILSGITTEIIHQAGNLIITHYSTDD